VLVKKIRQYQQNKQPPHIKSLRIFKNGKILISLLILQLKKRWCSWSSSNALKF